MSCSNKKSLNEIFYITSLLTCFVVLIHTGSEAFNYYEKGSVYNLVVFSFQKLMSFAVPGFIFLSAFKLFYSKNLSFSVKRYGKFMHKRIVKIFIPYAIFALIYYIYFFANNYMSFDLKKLVLGIFLRGDISSPFYFVIVIFQFYILTPVFNILFNKVSFKLAIPVAMVINILFKQFIVQSQGYFYTDIFSFYVKYNDRIFISYLAYWVLGGYFGLMYESVKESLLKNRTKVSIICIQIVLLHVAASYFNYLGLIYYKYAEIGHLAFCISAILLTYEASIALDSIDIRPFRNIVIKYSQISYYVYLSHVLFIYIADNAMNDASIDKIYIRWIIRTVTVFTASGVVALVLGSSPKKSLLDVFRKEEVF